PPSPPHINIPPAKDNSPTVLPQYVGDSEGENHEVLKHITQGNYSVDPVDWKYHWRRSAQPILAFLYLGPAQAARDLEYLKKEGITRLLAVRDTISAQHNLYHGRVTEEQLGIKTDFVNITDNQDLIRKLPGAIEKINLHLVEEFKRQGGLRKVQGHAPGEQNTWGKVLVFCESGNERSPAVVAAYMMAIYRVDLITAVQYTQQHRFCVAFDDALKNLLQSYEDILSAQRSVHSFSTAAAKLLSPGVMGQNEPSRGISTHSKRGREDLDDDDGMEVDSVDDEERFRGRATFTPFASRS
ncbi:tyrosine protein phosphatase 4, partial [Calycina marina]